MYIPFNEISLHEDFISSLPNFKKLESISEFIALYKVLKTENLLDGFLTSKNSLSEISNLITTEGLTPHLKQSLLITMKSFSQIDPDNSLDEFKIEVNQKTYSGLGCAYASRPEFNKVIINFRSHDLWEQDFVEGKYLSFIDKDCIEEIINLNQITLHDNIEIIKQISSSKKRNDISSGQDLWEKKEGLYPHLIFCDNVKKQLYDTPQMVHIESLMDKLDILENCLNENKSFSLVNLKDSGIDISPESPTVEKNPTLHNMRLFQLPNGNTLFFTYHIKFNTPIISPCRIYVYPDGDKCYIGYIGKHLPTAKF